MELVNSKIDAKEKVQRLKPEAIIEAVLEDGSTRSSVEVVVMILERRGRQVS